MISDPKQREQLILILLPAMVVGLIYVLFFFRGQLRSYQAAAAELENARHSAISEQELSIARTKTQTARQRRDELRSRIEETKAQLQGAAKSLGRDRPFRVVGELTRRMQEHHLALISQTMVETPKLSRLLQQMLENIDKWNGPRGLKFCEFQIEGRYDHVQQLLVELQQDDRPTFVLSLELTPSDSRNGRHTWTLVIVL